MASIVERLRKHTKEHPEKGVRDGLDHGWFSQCTSETEEAADEIERLMERLEMWPVDPKTREFDKSVLLTEDCDGISCRDETINQLEGRIRILSEQLTDKSDELDNRCSEILSALQNLTSGIQKSLYEQTHDHLAELSDSERVDSRQCFTMAEDIAEANGFTPADQRPTTLHDDRCLVHKGADCNCALAALDARRQRDDQ
ncbi:MAG TPA: hypothetical protein PKH39_18570 [Woeseiaceae bacterium]|nr:hypothetical protein [Woeseiaceae bacterium]